MPGFVKTPADEKKWQKAKKIVKEQNNVNFSDFKDEDWAFANYLFHNMKKGNTSVEFKLDQDIVLGDMLVKSGSVIEVMSNVETWD